MLENKRILLIVPGGIAAYKSLELARQLRGAGARVRAILTEAGAKFVTPLSLGAITGEKVYSDLFSLTDESEMGHIRLAREADLVVVSPATADILAKMVQGLASDLATTALLATDKPVLVAPAMNVRMWEHAATRANMETLVGRGIMVVGPGEGDLACGEEGVGRLAEVDDILAAIVGFFAARAPLRGRRAIVTSGPTFEPLDPVRFIGNRSSGKQGHAIAAALAELGARTALISGPVAEPDPAGVEITRIETALEMRAAVKQALPADVAVMVAAVADWRVKAPAADKIKKGGAGTRRLDLVENPDILAEISRPGNARPALVIGFAADTEDIVANGEAKRKAKGCDWILANDVSEGSGVFGGSENTVHLIRPDGTEDWPAMAKLAVAARLAEAIASHFTDAP
ncbi:MAG: bifunctional phosphopantothenoylcysteine decarboxylase/phosphopantothenate--cysteine ligase CoaBC [Alphaproteobacteria bacterium]